MDTEFNEFDYTGDGRSDSDTSETADSSGNSGSNQGSVAKRGRGRPKGSKNKSRDILNIGSGHRNDSEASIGSEQNGSETGNNSGETSVSVQEHSTRKRGRPRKVAAKVIENPAEVSRLVLDKFEELASTLLGDDGKFQPTERFFLEVGMQDTLTKMPQEVATKVVAIVSPISLVIGVALYGVRVASVVSERRAQQYQQSEPEFIQDREYTSINEQTQDNSNGSFNLRETIVPPHTNLKV